MGIPEPERAELVDLGRTTLRTWGWGDVDDPLVLCLHGAYDHGRMFDGIAPRVAELGYHVGVGINRSDDVEVIALSTRELGLPPFRGARLYAGAFEIPELPLLKGEFVVYAFLTDERQLHVYDRRILRPAFRMASGPYEFALVRVLFRWTGPDGAAEAAAIRAAEVRR